jgi:hypothetical protein
VGETRSQNKVNTRDLRNATGEENPSVAPTKSTGQAIKAGPLEWDSRTSTKNLSTRAEQKKEELRVARYSTSEQIFHRAGNKTKNKRVLGERKLKTEQQTSDRTRSLRTLLRSG